MDFPQHEVAIGNSERPATPVTDRTGIGAGGLRPYPETGAVKTDNGTAARGHRMNIHHRRAHPHTGYLRLEAALILAVVMAHVRGGAAHIKADQFVKTVHCGGAGHAYDSARGAGEDGILALEAMGVGEAAVGLHEHQARAAPRRYTQFPGYLLHVAAQDGRQVSIHDGGIGTGNQLHQRTGFVAEGDPGKPDLPAYLAYPALMVVVAVTMDKDNGHRPDAGIVG